MSLLRFAVVVGPVARCSRRCRRQCLGPSESAVPLHGACSRRILAASYGYVSQASARFVGLRPLGVLLLREGPESIAGDDACSRQLDSRDRRQTCIFLRLCLNVEVLLGILVMLGGLDPTSLARALYSSLEISRSGKMTQVSLWAHGGGRGGGGRRGAGSSRRCSGHKSW